MQEDACKRQLRMSLLLKERILTKDIDVSSYSFYCTCSHYWLYVQTSEGSFFKKQQNYAWYSVPKILSKWSKALAYLQRFPGNSQMELDFKTTTVQ